MAIVISLFLLSTATASASEWNITLEATSHIEDVTFGISPDATDGYDDGIDEAAAMPGGVEASWTQMDLLTAEGAPMRIWINKDNMTWIMKVTINRMATTTISWDSASIPSFLDVMINGTTDMRSVSSMELSGDASDSVVHYVPITATIDMTVTATPSSVVVNTSTSVVFDVTSDGTPVVGATVTLSGAFDNVSTTGEDGTVTIEVNATSTGTINVIATEAEHEDAETTVTVTDQAGPVINQIL
jgi:hypothetical protein